MFVVAFFFSLYIRISHYSVRLSNFIFLSFNRCFQFLIGRKTGSLDNAIREFSLAKPSWYMSHYTMIYKNGERMRDLLGL